MYGGNERCLGKQSGLCVLCFSVLSPSMLRIRRYLHHRRSEGGAPDPFIRSKNGHLFFSAFVVVVSIPWWCWERFLFLLLLLIFGKGKKQHHGLHQNWVRLPRRKTATLGYSIFLEKSDGESLSLETPLERERVPPYLSRKLSGEKGGKGKNGREGERGPQLLLFLFSPLLSWAE